MTGHVPEFGGHDAETVGHDGPKYAPFMHLAVAGRAKLLVSGDRDLLALAEAFRSAHGCPIVPLEVFVRTCLAEVPGL